jgi:hypothetical protein
MGPLEWTPVKDIHVGSTLQGLSQKVSAGSGSLNYVLWDGLEIYCGWVPKRMYPGCGPLEVVPWR